MSRRLAQFLLAICIPWATTGCFLTFGQKHEAKSIDETKQPPVQVPSEVVKSPYQNVEPQPLPSPEIKQAISRQEALQGTETVLPLPPPAPLPTMPMPPLTPISERNPVRAKPIPDPPLVRALRAYMEQKPQEAKELLRRGEFANPEILERLLPFVVRASQEKFESIPPEELDGLREMCEVLSRRLRRGAELSIAKLCFCRDQARTFGVYSDVSGEAGFEAGIENQPGEQVLVYVELDDFVSQRRGSFHEVHLTPTIEIRDLQGGIVSKMTFPSSPDRTRSVRSDYFMTLKFHVPRRIPPNRYTLWVEVEDHHAIPGSPARVRRSLDFRVVEPRIHGSKSNNR